MREKESERTMIEFGTVGLTLSLPVAKALAAFVADERNPVLEAKEKPWLSVGIDRGEVCSTDGHGLVRFKGSTIAEGAAMPETHDRRYWPRGYVRAAILGASKAGHVLLEWSELGAGLFPRCSEVEPKGEQAFSERLMFDAQLLARLELVAKACRPIRQKGEDQPALPGVLFVSMPVNWFEPMRLIIGGDSSHVATPHEAWVTLMGMRHNDSEKSLRQAVKSHKSRAKKAKAA